MILDELNKIIGEPDLYIEAINDIPDLNNSEELELFKKINKGDKEAKKRLAKPYLKLVLKIAKEFKDNQLILIDLIQEGNVGLLRAVEKYDINGGLSFSDFAKDTIYNHISKYILENTKK